MAAPTANVSGIGLGHRNRGNGTAFDQRSEIMHGLLFVQQRGNDYYVDSVNGSASYNGGGWSNAKATLAQAMALCVSGDRIHLAPGHAESISGAAGIAFSASGITVIGYGHGNTRPTFTWAATGATFTVTGTDNVFINILTKVSVDEVVSMFAVSGARNKFVAVDFAETTSAQAIQWAIITGTEFEMSHCRHVQATAAAAAQKWIGHTAATNLHIHNNTFYLALNDAAAGGVIVAVTTQSTNILLERNNVKMTGYSANLLSAFLSTSGTTGMVCYNNIAADVAAVTTVNDSPGCRSFQNFCAITVDKSGILDPVV